MQVIAAQYFGISIQDPSKTKGLVEKVAELEQASPLEPATNHQEALASLIGLTNAEFARSMCAKKRHYIITKRASEVIENIKIPKQLEITQLSRLNDCVYCLNITKDIAYNVWIDKGELKFAALIRDESQEYGAGALSGSLSKIIEAKKLFKEEGDAKDFLDTQYSIIRQLVQTLIFLELTNPEIILIPAGKKASKGRLGYSNTGTSDVHIVDSTWNKYIVRIEGFGVSGHFRVQPCGVGLKDLKLVWINPYEKHGYVRKPKSAAA